MTTTLGQPQVTLISTWSLESIGLTGYRMNCTTFANTASSVWLAADRAIFMPLSLDSRITVVKFWVFNGAVVAGNLDIGLYDVASNLISSTGSTAQAGTTVIQDIDVTDFAVGPGTFYLALVLHDAATACVRRGVGTDGIYGPRVLGMAQQDDVLPLPAAATMVALATNYIPLFGIARVTTL